MKGDFTRSTFRKEKHYNKVNMQQGRVQVDADWNEQNDIQSHHERTFLRDLVGKSGTLRQDDGFRISTLLFRWDSIKSSAEISALPAASRAQYVEAAAGLRSFLKEYLGLGWISDDLSFTNDGTKISITSTSGAGGGTHSVVVTKDSSGKAKVAIDGGTPSELGSILGNDVSLLSGYMVGRGRYYVDGILCENEHGAESFAQPDLKTLGARFFVFRWGTLPGAGEQAFSYFLQKLLPGLDDGLPLPASSLENLTYAKDNSGKIITIKSSQSGSSVATLTLGASTAELKAGSKTITLAAEPYKQDNNNQIKDYDIYYLVPSPAAPKSAPGTCVAYLDVWDRHVTRIEDPYIQEKALGDVDTATRTRTAWQVKLASIASMPANQCNLWDMVASSAEKKTTGKLRARPKPAQEQENRCSVYETAGYTKLENQLYRVEVHSPGDEKTATFKWSRENGSVVSRVIEFVPDEDSLVIDKRGMDDNLDFADNNWIEVTDDLRESLSIPGTLVRIEKVEGTTIRYYPASVMGLPLVDANFGANRRVRRWESKDAGNPLVRATSGNNGGYFELEYGVEIQLTAGYYQTGDYWTVPARTKTGDVEWPQAGGEGGERIAMPPAGVVHHYAPLAVVQYAATGSSVSSVVDARNFFASLAELVSIRYAGGDGQEALPNHKVPAPLRVAVMMGQVPLTDLHIRGAKVRFSLVDPGAGALTERKNGSETGAPSATYVECQPNAEGIAECAWELGSAPREQKVKAELYICGQKVADVSPLYFTATLPVFFYYIQGDGQDAVPGSEIELKVGLKIGNDPVASGASAYNVRFTVQGGGSVSVSPAIFANGVATTTWTVGNDFFGQQVVAELYYGNTRTNLQPITFGARLPISFFCIRGDGEEAMPGSLVNVEVGIRGKAGFVLPTGIEFQVEFSAVAGGGLLAPASPVAPVPAAAATPLYSSAAAVWTLGNALLRQQAKAELFFRRSGAAAWQRASVPPVYFNARLPISFYYVRGDGAVPLQDGTSNTVEVEAGVMAKTGATLPPDMHFQIKFSVVEGAGGSLSPQMVSDVAATAKATWTLDDKALHQQAKAELFFGPGPTGPWTAANLAPVYFNARLPLSFYYVSGDGVEAPAGTEVALAAGVALGAVPVKEGYIVRFTRLVDAGDSVIEEQPLGEVGLDGRGIAHWNYELLPGSPRQQVRADLLLEQGKEPVALPPVYFNMETARQANAANTGLLVLEIPSLDVIKKVGLPLEYGPFYHYLTGIDVPPALLLGLVRKEGGSEEEEKKLGQQKELLDKEKEKFAQSVRDAVDKIDNDKARQYVLDALEYLLDEGIDVQLREAKLEEADPRLKKLGLGGVTEQLREFLAREKEILAALEKLYKKIASDIVHTEDYDLATGGGGGNRINFKPVDITKTSFTVHVWPPSGLKSSTTELLRWWAVPGTDQKLQLGTVKQRTKPKIVFDRPSYPPGAVIKATITHADANANPKAQDRFTIRAASTTDAVGLQDVDALETGINNGIFEAKIPTSQEKSAGALLVKAGDTVTVVYRYGSGEARASVRIEGAADPTTTTTTTTTIPAIKMDVSGTGNNLVVDMTNPDVAGDKLTVYIATSDSSKEVPVVLTRKAGTDTFTAAVGVSPSEGVITVGQKKVPLAGLATGSSIKATYRYGAGGSESVETSAKLSG